MREIKKKDFPWRLIIKRVSGKVLFIFYPILYGDPAHGFGNREDQDQNQEDRSYPFQHDPIEFFDLKGTIDLHFIFNDLRTDKMSDADAGQNGHDRHEHTVADEIEEIQQPQTDDLDEA